MLARRITLRLKEQTSSLANHPIIKKARDSLRGFFRVNPYRNMEHVSLEAQGINNRDLVNQLIQSHITRLFKTELALFESFQGRTITPHDLEQIRKQTLDTGNDTIREIQALIDVFDFYLNPSRLAAVKQTRKTVKKVIISGITSVG